jgi:hypothetical protein
LLDRPEGETLVQLIFLGNKDPEKVSIGVVSLQGKDELCIRRYNLEGEEGEKWCSSLDGEDSFSSVVEIGDNVLIVYEKHKVILDAQMKKIAEAKEKEIITFINGLNILEEPSAGKNLNADEEGQTLLFFNFGNPNGANNVQAY